MSIEIAEQPGQGNLERSLRSERQIAVTYLLGSLRDAGTERQALELVRNLDRRSFSVSVILMEDVGSGRLYGLTDQYRIIHVSQAGSSKWISKTPALLRAVVQIGGCLNQWRTDIVHAFLAAPSILGGIAGRMARVPVIIGSRRSMPSFYRANRGFFSTKADTLAFYLADVTLGNSTAVTNEMKSFGCPPRKCRTIFNGVDTVRFHPHVSRAWRQEMGWREDDTVFGMVANFRPCKRHCDFVQAAAILLRRYTGLRFVMVGADGGTRAEIEKNVRELRIQDSVFVIDSQPDPEKILAAIDVYVCTSETEGFSNVILEALACSKPVIATQVGGNPEIVRNGENGLLIPVRSPVAVAAAAGYLLEQPDIRISMGVRGRGIIESRFSLQSMVSEHEQLYSALISECGYAQR